MKIINKLKENIMKAFYKSMLFFAKKLCPSSKTIAAAAASKAQKGYNGIDKEKRERVERPNELYTSANGGIDPGFLKAKCIKHAFDTYPKLRIGKGSVLESQTIDEPQPSFDPYAGAADDTDNSQEQQEQQQEQQQAANDSFATTANPPAGVTINTNAGATDDVW